MTRRQIIVELARTLRDVTPGPLTGGGHHGNPESFSLELSRLYRAGSYAALEAALLEMRQPPRFLGTHMHQGHPLAMLRRHFMDAHVTATHKSVPARLSGSRLQVSLGYGWEPHRPSESLWMPLTGIYKTSPNGPGMVTVEKWASDVRHQLRELALDWLDHNLPAGLRLPDWDKLSERAAA